MILIITSKQQQIDSPVEERFGRSEWFIQIDTESKQWEVFANPGSNHSGGAGVAAAQFIIDQQASAVISGSFGPNAESALRAANIPMYVFSNSNINVQEALDSFQQGNLALMGAGNQ
jgi:predicted Fe-Mo cluster-binding NifX family protein